MGPERLGSPARRNRPLSRAGVWKWHHVYLVLAGLVRDICQPAPVAGAEENVTDLPSGVHAGPKLSFPSSVNLMLGPRSSRLIQILRGSALATLATASHFPSGERAGKPK